jgi:hypothetical protein
VVKKGGYQIAIDAPPPIKGHYTKVQGEKYLKWLRKKEGTKQNNYCTAVDMFMNVQRSILKEENFQQDVDEEGFDKNQDMVSLKYYYHC